MASILQLIKSLLAGISILCVSFWLGKFQETVLSLALLMKTTQSFASSNIYQFVWQSCIFSPRVKLFLLFIDKEQTNIALPQRDQLWSNRVIMLHKWCVCVHACVCMRTHVVCVCVCVCTHVCVCVCMNACMHACVRACVCVCVHLE